MSLSLVGEVMSPKELIFGLHMQSLPMASETSGGDCWKKYVLFNHPH